MIVLTSLAKIKTINIVDIFKIWITRVQNVKFYFQYFLNLNYLFFCNALLCRFLYYKEIIPKCVLFVFSWNIFHFQMNVFTPLFRLRLHFLTLCSFHIILELFRFIRDCLFLFLCVSCTSLPLVRAAKWPLSNHTPWRLYSNRFLPNWNSCANHSFSHLRLPFFYPLHSSGHVFLLERVHTVWELHSLLYWKRFFMSTSFSLFVFLSALLRIFLFNVLLVRARISDPMKGLNLIMVNEFWSLLDLKTGKAVFEKSGVLFCNLQIRYSSFYNIDQQ